MGKSESESCLYCKEIYTHVHMHALLFFISKELWITHSSFILFSKYIKQKKNTNTYHKCTVSHINIQSYLHFCTSDTFSFFLSFFLSSLLQFLESHCFVRSWVSLYSILSLIASVALQTSSVSLLYRSLNFSLLSMCLYDSQTAR